MNGDMSHEMMPSMRKGGKSLGGLLGKCWENECASPVSCTLCLLVFLKPWKN